MVRVGRAQPGLSCGRWWWPSAARCGRRRWRDKIGGAPPLVFAYISISALIVLKMAARGGYSDQVGMTYNSHILFDNRPAAVRHDIETYLLTRIHRWRCVRGWSSHLSDSEIISGTAPGRGSAHQPPL